MHGFKRFCTVVFVLATCGAFAALLLTWYGPWTDVASALLMVQGYAGALFVCLAISACGLLILLLRALFVRKPHTIEVATVDGGSITVTCEAIASQATHIVESDSTCTAARVRVDAKAHGRVRVQVRVLPRVTLDVVRKGAELHEALTQGLAAVCGDTLEKVDLEFVEPESLSQVEAPQDEETDAPSDVRLDDSVEDVPQGTSTAQSASTSEITVSMGSAHDEQEQG